ncbi:hypothetical protein [Actinocrispum wychmicini]|uniref:Uncharacterized protein n=1 Tax=Actinocrispum wychmicini TaxID=1213861 RepID=A0A4R2K7Q0_9PSEU|nr:hypothetical protein [Actinocrispum wychmicini]TCO62385.1 hypothetical protein EV192_102523 [Actinocrispum wychmicini]
MPEPILVSIAAALATKGVQSLYDLVRRKFADRREANAALAAAQGAAPDSAEVIDLADHLASASAEDPTFAEALHREWQSLSVQHVENGSVANEVTVTGNVGNVIQATNIQGGLTLHQHY